MLVVVIVSVIFILLSLGYGAVFGSKNHMLLPITDDIHTTLPHRIEFINIDPRLVYSVDIHTIINSPLFQSPDSSQIAFEVTRDGINDLYVMNTDGGRLQWLINGGVDYESVLAWSPDSQEIAYISPLENEIHLIDVQQKTTALLASKLTNAQLPIWSPDGSQLAFVSRNDLGQSALRLIDSNGKNLREASKGFEIVEDLSLHWSPDGKSVTFVLLMNGAINIYRLDVTTGDLTALTNSAAMRGNPVWSPDGQHIAFWEQGGYGFFIDRMNPDGSNAVRLNYIPNTGCIGLFWSDDSQQIGIETFILNESAFYLMNADGSNLHRLFGMNTSFPTIPIWHP